MPLETREAAAQSMLFKKLTNVFMQDDDYVKEHLHPDFLRYFSGYFARRSFSEDFLAWIEYMVRKGNLSGSVLDLAAGFGVNAVCMRALGVPRVVGLDVIDTKVTTSQRLAALVGADELEFVRGSAMDIPFADASFDGVLIVEAVSHILDPEKTFREVRRVLRPGGHFVVYEDRNAFHPRVRRNTKKCWARSEFGDRDTLAKMGGQVNYCEMRRDFILREFPDIDRSTAETIARSTRGHTYETLRIVVSAKLEGRRVNVSPVAPCVNPENKVVQERLTNPLATVSKLRRLGFKATVFAPHQWDVEH